MIENKINKIRYNILSKVWKQKELMPCDQVIWVIEYEAQNNKSISIGKSKIRKKLI